MKIVITGGPCAGKTTTANKIIHDYLEAGKTVTTISIDDYYDKYIIQGNTERKSVALVFKITSNNNLQELINILNNKNIKNNPIII